MVNKASGNPEPKDHLLVSKDNSMIHILNGVEEFFLDADGFIIGSNLEAVNVTGYDEYEVIGKHVAIFYGPDEAEKASEDLQKALRLGTIMVSRLMFKKRGVSFWAKMKIVAMDSHNGGPQYNVLLQDATHRALSKARLRTLRDEYLSIFNNPFIGNFKFRMSDGRVWMCNQKTLDMLGRETSADLHFENFFSSLEQYELLIAQIQSQKKVEGFKFIRHDERHPRECWAMISVRYFEQDGFVEGVWFDISEQQSQMQELLRVNSELDNFIYHASHDLRSPLTSILGLLQLAKKETAPDHVQGYLGMIEGRIIHMDRLLKDLISISYNSEAEQKRERFIFKDEIKSLLEVLKTPDQDIDVALDINEPCEFITDPVRVRTILINLLSNAIKYVNPAVEQHRIHINIKVNRTHAAIRIKDNGIGIAAQYKNRVYDMFFRATEKSNGSGLGLYIVKTMVDKLRGTISFQSTVNAGTTFLVTVPNLTSHSKLTYTLNAD